MLYDGTSASNLGAGADGKVAAPAQFSKHTVARYLRRRITCGADHAVRGATAELRHVTYSPLPLHKNGINKEQG